ncbi:MAG: ankyrin repeat domain-containing protein [Tepidisphaeraceae bacterium]
MSNRKLLPVVLLGAAMLTSIGCQSTDSSGKAMYEAARTGNVETVKQLIADGTPVDVPYKNGRTGLLTATHQSQMGAATALLDAGADPGAADADGKTPLMWASSRGYIPLLNAMIAKKPNLNAQDDRGYTALMHAAGTQQMESIKTLVAAGADPSIADNKGRTPTDVLAIRGLSIPSAGAAPSGAAPAVAAPAK